MESRDEGPEAKRVFSAHIDPVGATQYLVTIEEVPYLGISTDIALESWPPNEKRQRVVYRGTSFSFARIAATSAIYTAHERARADASRVRMMRRHLIDTRISVTSGDLGL